jgi:hypothetical protein
MPFIRSQKRDDSAFFHLLVSALAACNRDDSDLLVGKYREQKGWYITFQIEGVDIPLKEIMDKWEEQLDRLVADKAKELLKEKFASLDEVLNKVSDLQIELVKKVYEDLGLEVPEE